MDLMELHELLYPDPVPEPVVEPVPGKPTFEEAPLVFGAMFYDKLEQLERRINLMDQRAGDDATLVQGALDGLRQEIAALTTLWLESRARRPTHRVDPTLRVRAREMPAPLNWTMLADIFEQYGPKDMDDLVPEGAGFGRTVLRDWVMSYAIRAGREEEYTEKVHQVRTRRSVRASATRARRAQEKAHEARPIIPSPGTVHPGWRQSGSERRS